MSENYVITFSSIIAEGFNLLVLEDILAVCNFNTAFFFCSYQSLITELVPGLVRDNAGKCYSNLNCFFLSCWRWFFCTFFTVVQDNQFIREHLLIDGIDSFLDVRWRQISHMDSSALRRVNRQVGFLSLRDIAASQFINHCAWVTQSAADHRIRSQIT